jgi:hypothetical protein
MLTDKREQLPVMWDNVQVNSELIDSAGGSATVVELDWNEPDADPDVLDQDYDWIFGADVTYDVSRMPALAKLLRQMVLTNPTAVVKLAHMHRSKDIDKSMREIFAGGCVWGGGGGGKGRGKGGRGMGGRNRCL